MWILSRKLCSRDIENYFVKKFDKEASRETGGFSDIVRLHFCAHTKTTQASFERDSPRLRMTLEYFVRMSGTMMRSYFMKGKKQKFGSTLSTVIDVCILFALLSYISIELLKIQLYSSYEFTLTNYNHDDKLQTIYITSTMYYLYLFICTKIKHCKYNYLHCNTKSVYIYLSLLKRLRW